jgi:arylsulfatase
VGCTRARVFFAEETTDIGYEFRTPGSPEHTPHGNKYTGKINRVQPDAGTDDSDQFSDPEERLHVATARR